MARCGCTDNCTCLIIQGENVTVTGNGAAATPYVISAPSENIRDVIAAALVEGSGIEIVVDDDGDTITISNTETGGSTFQSSSGVGTPTTVGRELDDLHYATDEEKEYILLTGPATVGDGGGNGVFANAVFSGGSGFAPYKQRFTVNAPVTVVGVTLGTRSGPINPGNLVGIYDDFGNPLSVGATVAVIANNTTGDVTIPSVNLVPGVQYRLRVDAGNVALDDSAPVSNPDGVVDTVTALEYGGADITTRAMFFRLLASTAGVPTWTSTDEYVGPHTHAATGVQSTVGIGPAAFGGRIEGDFHHDTLIGREFVLTGVAGAGFVTEDFSGPAGTLDGKATTTGGKFWDSDTAFVLGGDGTANPGPSGGFNKKAFLDLGVVPTDVTAWFIPDPIFSHFYLYACNSAYSLGGGAQTNGYQLGLSTPIDTAGTVTKTWQLYRLDTNVIVASGSVTFDTANPLVFNISRTAGGVVTVRINGDTLYTGTPGVPVGNMAGVMISNFGSTPKITDFSAGDSGSLAWVPSEPIYLQALLVSGTVATGNHILKPGVRVPAASILREFVLRCETAPTGAPITVQVERFNGGVSQGIIATASIVAGANVGSAVGLAAGCAKGDILKFNVTSVGSTVAGTDLSASLDLR